MDDVITIQEVYLAEYNGFYGIGHTEEEAEIAVIFAARTLPLEESRGSPKTAYYHQLPDGEKTANAST